MTQENPTDTKPTITDTRTTFDKVYAPISLLVYTLLAVLIITLSVSSKLTVFGNPDLIFDIPILLGTLIGGVATLLGCGKAIAEEATPRELMTHIAQTIAFWGIFVGTLGGTIFETTTP